MTTKAAPASCVHRWRIAEANGSPVVTGRCQLCGAERDYWAAGRDERDWVGNAFAAATAASRPGAERAP